MTTSISLPIIAVFILVSSCSSESTSESTTSQDSESIQKDSVTRPLEDTSNENLVKIYDTTITTGSIRNVEFYMGAENYHLICRVNHGSNQDLGRHTSFGEQPPYIEPYFLGDSIGLGYLLTNSLIAMDTCYNVISILRINSNGKCDAVLQYQGALGKCHVDQVNDDFDYYSLDIEREGVYSKIVLTENFPSTSKRNAYSARRVFVWEVISQQYVLAEH